jgi:hypothetical protein
MWFVKIWKFYLSYFYFESEFNEYRDRNQAVQMDKNQVKMSR